MENPYAGLGLSTAPSAGPEVALTPRTPRTRITGVAVGDATSTQVVGRRLDGDLVADDDADVESPHLARRVSEYLVPTFDLDHVLAVGQYVYN